LGKTDLCKNVECKNKYWCGRYRAVSQDDYGEATNLNNSCNKDNEYKMYKHWQTKKKEE
jgi:hypothetical protein